MANAVQAFLLVVATAIMLGGCDRSRGIVPAGPDTYTLTERHAAIRGGRDEAGRDALLQAHDFCITMGGSSCPSLWVKQPSPLSVFCLMIPRLRLTTCSKRPTSQSNNKNRLQVIKAGRSLRPLRTALRLLADFNDCRALEAAHEPREAAERAGHYGYCDKLFG
jgi:hypothetical protein